MELLDQKRDLENFFFYLFTKLHHSKFKFTEDSNGSLQALQYIIRNYRLFAKNFWKKLNLKKHIIYIYIYKHIFLLLECRGIFF